MKLITGALTGFFIWSGTSWGMDFPVKTWPQDLLCRHHDVNNGTGIFFTREISIRFQTPRDAEATIRAGLSYGQVRQVCATKEFLVVNEKTPGIATIDGKIECVDDKSGPTSAVQTRDIDLNFDSSTRKLKFQAFTFECQWQDFWN